MTRRQEVCSIPRRISRPEIRTVLSTIFSCLNWEEKRVVALRFVQGKPLRTIAKARKISVRRVKEILETAIGKIQSQSQIVEILRPLLSAQLPH